MARIAAGYRHTVGRKSDGTAVSTSAYIDDTFTDLVSIFAGSACSAGKKSDGTYVAAGTNSYLKLDPEGWVGAVEIAMGTNHTLALSPDGTVIGYGLNHSVYHQLDGVDLWTGIIAVSADIYSSIGLKGDGTAVASGLTTADRTAIAAWTGIEKIAAGENHTLGLKADGTVIAVGSNTYGQLDVGGWTDIVAIAAAHWFSLGLKADGTVVSCGYNYSGQTDVSTWTDIVEIAAGYKHSIGLKSDGTAIATGETTYAATNVTGWTDIMDPVVEMQEIYPVGIRFRLTLTDLTEPANDFVLPISNANGRIKSGSPSYLQVTLPYTTSAATAISDRSGFYLQLDHVEVFSDGSEIITAVVTVALETVQISRGVSSSSIVLTGHRQTTNYAPASHTVSPLSMQTGSTSNTVILPGYNPLILPADTVTADGVTFTVGTVSLQASVGSVQTQLIEG